MNLKRYVALILTAFVALTPLFVAAERDMEQDQETAVEETKDQPKYVKYEGQISEVNRTEKEDETQYSILVQGGKAMAENELVFHLGDKVVLLDALTMEFVSLDRVEAGMQVSAFYTADTPMMLSMPGQLTPEVIIMNAGADSHFVHLAHFGEDRISDDIFLALNMTDETEMVDTAGNEVEQTELANRDLIVFYTASTKSIPAETTPEKVILFKDQEAKDGPKYVKYEGQISEVNRTEKEDETQYSILVQGGKAMAENELVFHLGDKVVLLDALTMEFVSLDRVEAGMQVSAFYAADTPMMLSMPGQLTPEVIIMNAGADSHFVHLAHFGEDRISDDNFLSLNMTDETEMVDTAGNEVEQTELANRDLIVFYTVSTKSIPAETTPEKIILFKDQEKSTTPQD